MTCKYRRLEETNLFMIVDMYKPAKLNKLDILLTKETLQHIRYNETHCYF